MKLPSLKSMYLLRGTLIALAAFWAFMFLLLWPMSSIFSPDWWYQAQCFFFISLPIAVIGGFAYAADMRNRDSVRALITDDQLPDHERDTLRAIRAASPWTANLPTKTLHAAYLDWCQLYFDNIREGEWVDEQIPKHLTAFLSWAFTRPIDRY